MVREIGSDFDLNPNVALDDNVKLDLAQYGLSGTDVLLLTTGRGVQGLVLDEIEKRNPKIKKVAIIPPFTCHTVIEPFIQHNYELLTYPVDRTLHINREDFRNCLRESKAQVVLIHRYFGFDTLKEFGDIIQDFSAKEVVFIEDKTQCIYSEFIKLSADYTVGSLRKWIALPDGGYGLCKQGTFSYKPQDYDKELVKEKLEAFYLKYDFIHERRGKKQTFLKKFQRAEELLDTETDYYKISPESESIQQRTDISELKRRRRKNYSRLYQGLKTHNSVHSLMPELSENDVPLYFVIMVERRKEMQEWLRLNDIYAPIVWPKPELLPAICEEAKFIYNHALCLPIDQRYDIDSMEKILNVIKEYEDQ